VKIRKLMLAALKRDNIGFWALVDKNFGVLASFLSDFGVAAFGVI